ncbi:response regulator transcription factor [Sanyastnella coralliicola]|uniref:response regulator transcription factor n=1 Tax=Sanyastnella coralliicola TaxID=3069118 RepID=UPI0027B91583|nr:response regulator [Longitalea sp. SCSIO 12813]
MKRILIVDDEPNIVMSLEYYFRKKGFDVFIARNGTEALDAVDQHQPELVILDIMMPDIDGYEVCERIKSNETSKNTKIIFLSAKSRKEDIEKGYASGANLYMQKPFKNKELYTEVTQLLE